MSKGSQRRVGETSKKMIAKKNEEQEATESSRPRAKVLVVSPPKKCGATTNIIT